MQQRASDVLRVESQCLESRVLFVPEVALATIPFRHVKDVRQLSLRLSQQLRDHHFSQLFTRSGAETRQIARAVSEASTGTV